MQFEQLIQVIQSTHEHAHHFALQQVNKNLTIRNWLIGCYLVEYEQNGDDRAAYGSKLLVNVANILKQKGLKGLDDRTLRSCRSFYNCYPQIWGSVTSKLKFIENQYVEIWRSLNTKLNKENKIISTQTYPNESNFSFPPEILLTRLSFTHFIELVQADTPLKRVFYEVQSIKNNWGVRELKRAMDTLLFERTGLSTNKEAVIAKAKDEVPELPKDIIKNPYLLEFLGLEEKPEYSETDLEEAIINHLQKFLVEMGRGFCFEARQKRITFANKHYFIDLVFYHRILKCHILVDLKVGDFNHADAGQMNMYLNYFRKNEMTQGDNPSVGIILCASKSDSLVEYATAGLAQEVFVSKYLVQLPSVEELKKLVQEDTRKFHL